MCPNSLKQHGTMNQRAWGAGVHRALGQATVCRFRAMSSSLSAFSGRALSLPELLSLRTLLRVEQVGSVSPSSPKGLQGPWGNVFSFPNNPSNIDSCTFSRNHRKPVCV